MPSAEPNDPHAADAGFGSGSSAAGRAAARDSVRALVFDVFGTVVDWRTSVVRELQQFAERHALPDVDWPAFADDWRAGYSSETRRLSRDHTNWRTVDQIHRARLDQLLADYSVSGDYTDADLQRLNRAWHRLGPWDDSPGGLTRLKSRYIIATLSNGNLSLLVNMAKHAALPWDAIFSPDVVGGYKPDPRVYSTACQMLALDNRAVTMVAAHRNDLEAASEIGLRTAFVHRPRERGAQSDAPMPEFASAFDYAATDMHDLADQLGCD